MSDSSTGSSSSDDDRDLGGTDADDEGQQRLFDVTGHFYDLVKNRTEDHLNDLKQQSKVRNSNSRTKEREVVTWQVLKTYFNNKIKSRKFEELQKAITAYEDIRNSSEPIPPQSEWNKLAPGVPENAMKSAGAETRTHATFKATWTTPDGSHSQEIVIKKNPIRRSKSKAYPEGEAIRELPNLANNYYKLISMMEQYVLNHDVEEFVNDELLFKLRYMNEYESDKSSKLQAKVATLKQDVAARQQSIDEYKVLVQQLEKDVAARDAQIAQLRSATTAAPPVANNPLPEAVAEAVEDEAGRLLNGASEIISANPEIGTIARGSPSSLPPAKKQKTGTPFNPTAGGSADTDEQVAARCVKKVVSITFRKRAREVKVVRVKDGVVEFKLKNLSKKGFSKRLHKDTVAEFVNKLKES